MKKIVILILIFSPVILFAGVNGDFLNAVKSGNVKLAEKYISKGADLNVKESGGGFQNGETALIIAASDGNLKMVIMLLAKGADPNITNEGNSALGYAAASGYIDIIKLLVEKGAEVNVRDGNGSTPLISASANGHVEIVKFLLQSGADINIRDSSGKTVLDYVRNKVIREILTGSDQESKIQAKPVETPL